jgi:hypothetical protein
MTKEDKLAPGDACNTHLATEITDGKRTVCAVRGKVLIENN